MVGVPITSVRYNSYPLFESHYNLFYSSCGDSIPQPGNDTIANSENTAEYRHKEIPVEHQISVILKLIELVLSEA